jgi:hypothetical protein
MGTAMAGMHATTGPAGAGSMAASATASRFSVLALAMALFMFGHVVRVGDQLTPPRSAAGRAPVAGHACPPHLAPWYAALCKIMMGITMGYTLVLML